MGHIERWEILNNQANQAWVAMSAYRPGDGLKATVKYSDAQHIYIACKREMAQIEQAATVAG